MSKEKPEQDDPFEEAELFEESINVDPETADELGALTTDIEELEEHSS